VETHFPESGRGFDPWTGDAFDSGVMLNKNELGYGSMILGIFFFWNLVNTCHATKASKRLEKGILSLGFLFAIG
jgi:hypothetical protein